MEREHEVLLEVGGVARRLGVSASTVRNLERSGAIPASARLESSGRRVWRLTDLEDVPRRASGTNHADKANELALA